MCGNRDVKMVWALDWKRANKPQSTNHKNINFWHWLRRKSPIALFKRLAALHKCVFISPIRWKTETNNDFLFLHFIPCISPFATAFTPTLRLQFPPLKAYRLPILEMSTAFDWPDKRAQHKALHCRLVFLPLLLIKHLPPSLLYTHFCCEFG